MLSWITSILQRWRNGFPLALQPPSSSSLSSSPFIYLLCQLLPLDSQSSRDVLYGFPIVYVLLLPLLCQPAPLISFISSYLHIAGKLRCGHHISSLSICKIIKVDTGDYSFVFTPPFKAKFSTFSCHLQQCSVQAPNPALCNILVTLLEPHMFCPFYL